MLAVLLRDRRAFDRVVDKLTPDKFSEDHEIPLRVVWGCATSFVAEHDDLPGDEDLRAAIESRLQNNRDMLSDEQIAECDEIIDIAFGLRDDEIKPKVALARVAQFLEEKLVDSLVAQHSGDVAVDLPALLEEQVKQARSIASVEGGRLEPIFSADPSSGKVDDVRVEKITTHIDFFDAAMRGGMAPGEIYGLVAPSGGGKTTIAVALIVARAKEQKRIDCQLRREGRYVATPLTYIACWEEELESIQRRLITAWAKIRSDTVEECDRRRMSTRSRPASFKDYERTMYREVFASGHVPRGERERWDAAVAGINKYIRYIDFTGKKPELNEYAADMARGLAQVIANDQEENGNPGVAMVVADHADAAADMSIEWNGYDPSNRKRHLIGSFPRALKNRIAAPYQCPLWVMHQLKAEANDRPPGQAPKSTDHKEAKDFFHYCNFGWLLGTRTEDGLCILVNGKHRRNEKQRNLIIRIDGAMGTVRNTNGLYRIDKNKIVSTEDYNRVADGDDTSLEFGTLMSRPDDDADIG